MFSQRKDLSESVGTKKIFEFLLAEQGEKVEDGYWYHKSHWLSPNFLKMNTSWDKEWTLLIEEESVVDVGCEKRQQKFLFMADQPGFRIFLQKEPANPKDHTAIKVMGSAVINKELVHTQIGYLSKETAALLRDVVELEARPHSVYLPYEGRSFELNIKVLVKADHPINTRAAFTLNPLPKITPTPLPNTAIPGTAVASKTVSSLKKTANKEEHRLWLLLVVAGSIFIRDFFPFVSLIIGFAFIGCLIGLATSRFNTLASKVLKIDTAGHFEKALRCSLCGITGVILILFGSSVYYGNWNEQRMKVYNERMYEADYEYEYLVKRAIIASESGRLEQALLKAEEALAIPYASNYDVAQQIFELTTMATDPGALKKVLAQIPDNDFTELKDLGIIPSYFFSGYDGLDYVLKQKIRAAVEDVDALRNKKALSIK